MTSPTPPSPPPPDAALEKLSSAVTLSDMEIFIFPELLYSLVLANIMSPRIWAWREDPWFRNLEKQTMYKRVQRLKQYIIDHYEFNLDLDTWGLTTQEQELARFEPFIDKETISQSNALFGYTGDKYYFDIDIRRHFGLDRYTSNIIPYWKTETVEAMDAFRHCEGYRTGAGECVSLSTLYAAALFIVCGVPLDQIYLMATPLHSQNFVDVRDGVLTNNRRIVTKNMWFNGTELTARAQRALRNEQITIVAHHTGYVHTVYPEATIAPSAFEHFKQTLSRYLGTEIDAEILGNFLRYHSDLQKCFQIQHVYHGKSRYIEAEKVYAYEHGSPYRASDRTRDKLMEEIDEYAFYSEPIEGRIPLNKFDDFFKKKKISVCNQEDLQRLAGELNCHRPEAPKILEDLLSFTCLKPRYPDADKEHRFVDTPAIELTADMGREGVIAYLESIRAEHLTADLAFHAYRDVGRAGWTPFMKAALERNPVCVDGAKDLDDDALVARLEAFAGESVYDGNRMAQPDEVWNFARGDGLEKAICLATIWKARRPEEAVRLRAGGGSVELTGPGKTVRWETSKGLELEQTL